MKIIWATWLALAAVSVHAESLDSILSRMDQASPSFKGVNANVKMTTFTAVINDTSVETGTFKMQKQKSKAVNAIIDFSADPNAQVIYFHGSTARIFYPKTKAYQDYDLGKNSNVLNQYLLLGFGSSGSDLRASYEITVAGPEKLAGVETTKLVLTPKDDKVKENLLKVEVWIPEGMAYPAQQKFFKPQGNYTLVTYSDVQLNPSVKGTLEFRLPSGAKKQGS